MATDIKKISVKTVYGSIGHVKKGETIELATIFGRANDSRLGVTQYGEFVCLLGLFGAVNKQTGEEFRSTQCFLPGQFGASIARKLQEGPADFVLDVDAVASDKGSLGYEYLVHPIMEAETVEVLQGLRARVPALAGSHAAALKGPTSVGKAKK